MGNGQCPDCCGLEPGPAWEMQDQVIYDLGTDMGADPDRPMYKRPKGHKKDCPLKAAIDAVEEQIRLSPVCD